MTLGSEGAKPLNVRVCRTNSGAEMLRFAWCNVTCALDKLPHTEETAEVGKPQIQQCFLRGEERNAHLLGSITKSAWTLSVSLNNVSERAQWLFWDFFFQFLAAVLILGVSQPQLSLLRCLQR